MPRLTAIARNALKVGKAVEMLKHLQIEKAVSYKVGQVETQPALHMLQVQHLPQTEGHVRIVQQCTTL